VAVRLGLPVAAGVYVVVQVAVAPVPERLQGVGLKESPVVGEEKLTDPVGVLVVPASVSVTVAVQVVPTATSTVLGEQAIEVLVVRRLTVSVVEPLLVACLASAL
jgi:hypothetical protein